MTTTVYIDHHAVEVAGPTSIHGDELYELAGADPLVTDLWFWNPETFRDERVVPSVTHEIYPRAAFHTAPKIITN